MSDLGIVTDRARSLVGDGNWTELPNPGHELSLEEALRWMERHFPNIVIDTVAGDGTAYEWELGADIADVANNLWVNNFSQVREVEYPSGNRIPTLLEADEWGIYWSDQTTAMLRFKEHTPGATETVRITYTARHTLEGLNGAAASTIDSHDLEAIGYLMAAGVWERLAAKWVDEQDSGAYQESADVVDRDTKHEAARRMAGRLRGTANDLLGGRRRGEQPVIALIDWDTDLNREGISPLTHRTRRRW